MCWPQGGKTIKGITAASGVSTIETGNNGNIQVSVTLPRWLHTKP